MTKTAKRDAARRELLRLLKGLDFYRAWRISGIKVGKGGIRQEDLNDIVAPGTVFLEAFDKAGGQYSQILQVVCECYAHIYSDFCDQLNAGDRAISSEIRQFLQDFRSDVGFDFQSEAGLVAKTIKEALKRGKITKDKDYFLLKELENDTGQTLLKERELDAVFKMLRDFEGARSRRAATGSVGRIERAPTKTR